MKRRTVVLLGLGMQGKPALYDLMRWDPAPAVTVVDVSPECERYVAELGSDAVRAVRLDVARDPDPAVELMAGADVVVDLLPATLTFPVAELAVKAGTSVVSTCYLRDPEETDPGRISARIEAMKRLAADARKKGIVVLPEFGLDPGIDLVLASQAARELDEITELYSYGAGLPDLASANNPLRYKFSWSIEGLLYSYHRQARILKDGEQVTIPAGELFSPENVHLIDLPEMGGELECFLNGDAVTYARMLGLEDSLKSTARYTCRWPGHSAFWRVAANSGLLSVDPVPVGDTTVRPIDFLGSLLGGQSQFQFSAREQDIVLVRVDARGARDGKRVRIVYQLIAGRDPDSGFTGMGRTVGFPASIAARMILDGEIAGPGLIWPSDVPFDRYLQQLRTLGLEVGRCETEWVGDVTP